MEAAAYLIYVIENCYFSAVDQELKQELKRKEESAEAANEAARGQQLLEEI